MSDAVSSTSGPDSLRVYVNERGVSVPHGSVAVDAVRALFPDLAADVAAGRQRLTDSRGLPVEATVLSFTKRRETLFFWLRPWRSA